MNWALVKNSLLVASLATVVAMAFGFLAALCLGGVNRFWRTVGLACALCALALPPFLVANCWMDYLGHTGRWRSWLPLNIYSPGGTIWILGLMLWPITLFAVWGAWQRLEPAQLESDPAVRGTALLRALLLPLGRPAAVFAAALTFVLALNNFAVPALLQVKVLPAEMWVRFTTTFKTWEALVMAWPMFLAPILLLALAGRRLPPWPHWSPPVSARLFRRQLGVGWSAAAAGATVLVVALSVGLPLLQLAGAERTWTELPGALAAGQAALVNSVVYSAGAAFLVLALALPVSCVGSQRGELGRVGRWLIWLPFLVPGVVLGMGLIAAFNRGMTAWLYNSLGIVLVALVVRYFGPGRTAVVHARAVADRDLRDAALVEGASGWQVFRHAVWPQISSQVALAGYVVFLLCLWDVESLVLIYPPGGESLALRVFNLLHYGHNAQVNALCVLLLALALAPLGLWQVWQVVRRVRGGVREAYACGMVLAAGWLGTGCSPDVAPNQAAIRSSIFSRVEVIGTRGAGAGQLNKPRSVAVDAADCLYVVDMTGRVQKFTPAGVFQMLWQMPETDVGRPKGMCRDLAGNIVVNEPHYARVNHYRPDGKLVLQWGERGTNAGQIGFPRAAAVNSRNEIYVSEYSTAERVQRFAFGPGTNVAVAPRYLNGWGHMGSSEGEFNRPEGLAVDGADRVYVADSCNHRVQVFTREGRFLLAYGRAGRGPGELSYPYDICIDPEGRQYVCEFGNSRIQVFGPDHRPLEILGGPGAEPGRFSNPWGVALDSSGSLYVADSQNHRVQKFMR